MRISKLKFTILFLLYLALNGVAQTDQMIDQELHRLKIVLDKIATFIEILPENDIKQLLVMDLQKANEEYEKAANFAHNGQHGLARIHLRLAHQYLEKIESMVKSHPIFRIKFRERLDVKIQQAEEVLQSSQNQEALHMLNRAKFFRQKAFLSFTNDQSLNALEYYRLAMFFAEKTIQIGTAEVRDLNGDWQNILSETEMLLEKAKQTAANSQNSQFINMVEKADRELQEIRRLRADKRNNTAKERLSILHRSLYRIIDLAENIPQREEDRLAVDFETLKLAIRSLDTDLQNIDLPAANQLHFRISNLVDNIGRHFQDGNMALARQKILVANRLILNIYRLIESKSISSPDEISLQINRAKQNFEELQSISTNESFSLELLRLIKLNLDNAERASSNENYLQASFCLKMANRLILKYNRLRLIESIDKVEAKSVQSELERLENLINRIDLTISADEDFNIRYENSTMLYNIARNAFLEGNLELCQELTTMAINLITQ